MCERELQPPSDCKWQQTAECHPLSPSPSRAEGAHLIHSITPPCLCCCWTPSADIGLARNPSGTCHRKKGRKLTVLGLGAAPAVLLLAPSGIRRKTTINKRCKEQRGFVLLPAELQGINNWGFASTWRGRGSPLGAGALRSGLSCQDAVTARPGDGAGNGAKSGSGR